MPENHPAPGHPNLLLAGFGELARKLRRLLLRAAIARDARRLKKAETYLGWLGWQQADFSDEVLPYVRAINDFERAQGDLLNERADHASSIATLSILKSEQEAEFTRQLEHLAQERVPLVQARDAALERLSVKRRALDEAKARANRLAGEQKRMARRLETLRKTYPPPDDLRAQLLEIQNATSAIDKAKPHIQAEISSLLLAIEPLAADLKLRESLLSALEKKARKVRAGQATSARRLRRQIRTEARQKAAKEVEGRSLEDRKKSPFLRIGRVLADNNVSPINQPEALQAVLTHRESIVRRRAAIVDSIGVSSRVPPARLIIFWILLVIAVILLAVCAGFLVEGHWVNQHSAIPSSRETAFNRILPGRHSSRPS